MFKYAFSLCSLALQISVNDFTFLYFILIKIHNSELNAYLKEIKLTYQEFFIGLGLSYFTIHFTYKAIIIYGLKNIQVNTAAILTLVITAMYNFQYI